jgi:succinoglycan biosynthesis protein ExoA
MMEPERTRRCIVVIPCLNEAGHIKELLDRLSAPADRADMKIVVVDGGSTDGTLELLADMIARNPHITILHNRKRIQSAAINLAIEEFGDAFDYLIRMDAHGGYPEDYCERLIEEAEVTGADSVVVAMATKGFGTFQQATALAQNSRLGNGGAKHRQGARGHWTDHGHHALMRIAAFRAVGGYDEFFTHNEDAELDFRLRMAGYRIWMTDKAVMTYYPRAAVAPLFCQYLGYGRGRARNALKHGNWPRLRQMLPAMVVPVAVGASLAVLHWSAAVPFAAWAAICLGYGVVLGVGQRKLYGPVAGISAMIMHFAWSAGFWLQLLRLRRRRKSTPWL